MFAKTPVAGHIVGMILDDLANEFDPYAPASARSTRAVHADLDPRLRRQRDQPRLIRDRYGTYNALVPSTFRLQRPLPSGVAPNMVNMCLNSPTR